MVFVRTRKLLILSTQTSIIFNNFQLGEKSYTDIFKPDSTRSASTSNAKSFRALLLDMLKRGYWSQSCRYLHAQI